MLEQRCLVLGGRGFIGSHLTDALLTAEHHVCCFDQSPVLAEKVHPRLEHRIADWASDQDLESALSDCDVCFHLVSTTLPHTSNLDPVFDIESNLIRTIKLLDMAVKHGVKKIIFTSSGGTVYGKPIQVPIPESHPTEPTCSYGISKLAIEKFLALYKQLHGLDYTVLRIANPFGERQRLEGQQGAIAVFMGKVLRGETVEIWGDGGVVRDYIHISDVVQALLLAMTSKSISQGVFNIGSGQGYSLNEVLSAIEQVTSKPVLRRFLEVRTFDVPVSVLDISSAAANLGWKPQIPFLQGLQRFNNWIESTSGIVKNPVGTHTHTTKHL